MSLHENTATTLATPDESAVVDLVDGETTKYIGEAMREGSYALFRFEVTCEPQDLEISFRLADDGDAPERATTTTTDGAWATVPSAYGVELRFVLHLGAMDDASVFGAYRPNVSNNTYAWEMFAYEDAANLDVTAITPGTWYLEVIVVYGSLQSGFEIKHDLFGSRSAEFADFNGCELDDGALSMSVFSNGSAYTLREPFVAEPDYASCGNDTTSCYLGRGHPRARGAERRGVGPILGEAVVVVSTPEFDDEDFFLLADDARKFLGDFSEGWFTVDRLKNATLISKPPRLETQFKVNRTERAFDHEACGSILNAAELRGKICVVTRGTCFFSQKTLACQKAGAIATIIIDTEFEPLAAVSWVGAHDPQSMLIPTIVLPLLQGNRLLSAMYDGNVRALIEAYECRPAAKCQRCAPGFTSVETNCTTSRCPGMNEMFTSNCSSNGACVEREGALLCECEKPFSGDACDVIGTTKTLTRVSRKTVTAVLVITFSLVGSVCLLVVALQLRRRSRQSAFGHIIWKPDDDDIAVAPPSAPTQPTTVAA